jgi:hypothetical protein
MVHAAGMFSSGNLQHLLWMGFNKSAGFCLVRTPYTTIYVNSVRSRVSEARNERALSELRCVASCSDLTPGAAAKLGAIRFDCCPLLSTSRQTARLYEVRFVRGGVIEHAVRLRC